MLFSFAVNYLAVALTKVNSTLEVGMVKVAVPEVWPFLTTIVTLPILSPLTTTVVSLSAMPALDTVAVRVTVVPGFAVSLSALTVTVSDAPSIAFADREVRVTFLAATVEAVLTLVIFSSLLTVY